MEPRKNVITTVMNTKQGWEYTVMELGGHVDIADVNRLGQQGWELVAIMSHGMAYFKRPLWYFSYQKMNEKRSVWEYLTTYVT